MKTRELPGFGTSLVLHTTLAIVLCFLTFSPHIQDMSASIESFFETEAERTPEDFTRELSPDQRVSETLSVVGGAGGGLALITGGGGGGGGPAIRIDASQQLRDPGVVVVNPGDITLPGTDQLGIDLGESQIGGDPTAVAEGYGAALSRIAQEIIRMLREEKLLVVWLFDESESMKDDQKEIQQEFHKVYQELGLFLDREHHGQRDRDALLSAIHSFGQGHRAITERPTADISEVRRAIDKIGIDQTGKENLFAALDKVLDQYRAQVGRGRRKLAVVIVTDESGDDGQGPLLDETISKARRLHAPVYVLGREAVFGFPIARIRWRDPKYGLNHWLNINRGPETAYPELLQFDGLHQRWDAHPSGFAPYEQARLTKETGGIFFVLPNEEQNIVNPADIDKRKFAFLSVKEYIPELISRHDYEERRSKSRFRSAVWDVVKLLNPFQDKELHIQEDWYSTDPEKFKQQGQVAFQRALRVMGLLNQANKTLEGVKSLRENESSPRWRADYDLASAQLVAYRVRLFQFLLVMDSYLNNLPLPQNKQHNVWNVRRTQEMTTPSDRQVKLTRVDLDELKEQLAKARTRFQAVIENHPGTPWANRAEYELKLGFGMRWDSSFRDPRYDRLDITFPPL